VALRFLLLELRKLGGKMRLPVNAHP
jgi:hypothetical protein